MYLLPANRVQQNELMPPK